MKKAIKLIYWIIMSMLFIYAVVKDYKKNKFQ